MSERLARHPATSILLSSMVVSEIEFGIAKSARRAHNRQVFDALLAGFPVVDFDAEASRVYGPIRAEL